MTHSQDYSPSRYSFHEQETSEIYERDVGKTQPHTRHTEDSSIAIPKPEGEYK